ncbi:MAG TPA: bifunctional serine/threonine-protein kinase/formylglycine-generating enzyme family protein [Bacteroidales bacterium]|nr:bifunctional serine/threonine-protein kinase/formylglycine-generating enzyme family protein [Bacteroidales bacterium]
MTDTNIGRRLGNYVIETFLAEGGMSRVYQGRHTMLGRRAAIKVLKPELLFQESLLWRFKNEAVAMEKLADSHDIINVYDFYEEGNFLAIIMELLEGETLKARIQHKAMNDVEIKQIFPRVLDAFGFAHKKGIIHRDVKPSNIFLLNDGGLRILDFGIAKIGDSENKSDYTATGTQMGTVIYMSPEQVLDAKHLDLRSDIYSIGVSLYHCITGKAPYDIESLSRFEIQRRIVYEPIEGIQTLAEPFRSIIEKCTAKKPENRFQSCKELKSALLGVSGVTEQGTEVQQPQLALIPEIKTGAVPEQQPQCTTENPDGNEKTIFEATSTTPKITAKPQEKSAPTKPKTKKKVILISVAAGVVLFLTLLIWQPWKASDTETLEVSEVPLVEEPVAPQVSLATLSTGTTTNITETSASITVNVTNSGGGNVSERGIVYSTSSNPTTSSNKLASGSGTGGFTASLSSLQSNTKYYARAYASNEAGIAYSDEISFTTKQKETQQTQQTQQTQNQGSTINIPIVYVSGGSFMMGCTSEQSGYCFDDEKPAHSVTVSSFYMGKYEVTQGQWKAVMGSNPSSTSYGIGDNYPVNNVSWNDIQKFITKLNQTTGKHYRLPTEAEWEFAARGGNSSNSYKYSGSNNIGSVAWYNDNSGSKSHPVGTGVSPNELGIYDMSGNVWEWCSDWYKSYPGAAVSFDYTGSHRVLRGGGWSINARFCRVSLRYYFSPVNRYFDFGFRLVLVP